MFLPNGSLGRKTYTGMDTTTYRRNSTLNIFDLPISKKKK